MLHRVRRPVVFRFPFVCLLLFVTLAAPSFYEMRAITLKILGDEEFRRMPDWKTRAEYVVRAASSEFEEKFGLQFIASRFEEWTSDDSIRSLDSLADDLDARATKDGCDIILALTGQENLGAGYFGYSLYKEGLVLLRHTNDTSRVVRTIKHELGHQFGAVHVADPDSVMDNFARGATFDALNSRAIGLNRDRLFNRTGFPLPKSVLPAAVRIYSEICESVKIAIRRQRIEDQSAGIRAMADENGRPDPFYLDDAFVFLAQIHLENKDYEKTLEACREALAIDPGNIETENLVGIALRRKGFLDEAIDQYNKILARKPRLPRVLYNLGIALAKKGDLASARRSYERALEIKPNFAEAHNNLGEVCLRLGQIEESERETLLAISLAPEFALARSNLAEVYCRKKDYEKSLTEAQAAVALDADLADPHVVIGNIHHQRGNTDGAMKEYFRALALDPASDKALYNLGLCFFDKNLSDEAKRYFLKALDVNKSLGEAHAGLGYCLLRENKPDEAIIEIRRAHEAGFRSAKTFANLSSAYLQKNDIELAMAEARRAIELEPDLAGAHNNLGIALMKKGDERGAAAEWQKALEAEPGNKEACFNLGNFFFQANRLDEALGLYLKALGGSAYDGALHNNIAVIYYRKAEYKLAWDHAEKAQANGFKVHPDFLSELRKKVGR
jgi:tetratricopeptide (TPR) repeat protein